MFKYFQVFITGAYKTKLYLHVEKFIYWHDRIFLYF